MSYKHLDRIQSLYESVSEVENSDNELIDDIVTVVSTSMFVEGYTTTAIRSYFECSDPVNIIEKYEEYAQEFSYIDESNLTESVDDELVYGYILTEESLKDLNEILSALKPLARKVIAPAARVAGKGLRKAVGYSKNITKGKASGKAVNAVKDAASNTVSQVATKVKPAGNLLQRTASSVKNSATNAVNTVKKQAGNVAGAVKSAVKDPKASVGKVVQFAKNNPLKAGILAGAPLVGAAIGLKNRKKNTTTSNEPQAKASPKKSSGLSFGDAIKASKTDAGKDLVKSVTTPSTPSKPSTASGKELPKAKAVKKGSAKANMIARNKETFGGDKVDKLRSKNAAFQAAKKSGSNYSMDDFVKDFPNSNAAKDRKKSKRVTSVMDMESVQYDAFDIVSNYLIDSNQVENMDEALYVMTEMDAQTIQGIVEDFKKKA